MNTPIMNIQSLSKKYDNFKLQDITLDIPRGCILGLVGQNGAGKSTLLKCIFQMIAYDSGDIFYDGLPLSQYGNRYKEEVSFVSEEQSFYNDMTIAWHINLARRFF